MKIQFKSQLSDNRIFVRRYKPVQPRGTTFKIKGIRKIIQYLFLLIVFRISFEFGMIVHQLKKGITGASYLSMIKIYGNKIF
jgi:hypothetical protein